MVEKYGVIGIFTLISRGTSSVRPQSERPSDATSVPKSEMSIPISPTDRDPDMDSPQNRQSKKSFHILASESYFVQTKNNRLACISHSHCQN